MFPIAVIQIESVSPLQQFVPSAPVASRTLRAGSLSTHKTAPANQFASIGGVFNWLRNAMLCLFAACSHLSLVGAHWEHIDRFRHLFMFVIVALDLLL